MTLPQLLGTTTVGERGQIVIPADARDVMDIKPGDKLLVFKPPIDNALIIAKPETFEKLIAHLGAQFTTIKSQHVKKSK